jgi:hypothetical protein
VAEPEGLTGYFSVGGNAGEFSEVQSGPGQTFQIIPSAVGQPLMVKKLYCLYSPTINQLWEFLYRLVGWPYLSTPEAANSVLYRAIPESLFNIEVPSFTPGGSGDGHDSNTYTPIYYCTRILGVTGEMPKGWADSSLANPSSIPSPGTTPDLSYSFGMYKNYFIEALFEEPIYSVKTKDEITYEGQRYTYRREQTIDQPLQINSNRQTIQWKGTPNATNIDGVSFGTCGTIAQGTPFTSEILWAEDRRLVVLDWLDLPALGFDEDRLSKWKNSVNESSFLDYNSGTLLYTGWQKTTRRHQLGMFVYDIQLQFEFYAPEHNRRLNPKLLYQNIELVSQDVCSSGSATTTKVFPERNFTRLFDSP